MRIAVLLQKANSVYPDLKSPFLKVQKFLLFFSELLVNIPKSSLGTLLVPVLVPVLFLALR